MSLAIAYPAIDPVAVEIGPLVIRWYALAYVTGILGGWGYLRWLAARTPSPGGAPVIDGPRIDDLVVWATLGVVLGGRLGYVLFYKPGYYLANPLDALQVWQGGMAFHGGVVGVLIALWLFCKRRGLSLTAVGDLVCAVVPIGLFLGRIANFINGELWGRPAPDVPWAMVFPHAGPVPRHPSQLYEAALEGLLLLIALHLLWRLPAVRRQPGTLAGCFLLGYGLARGTAEFFREPDAHLGFLFAGATMGQLLCLPMIAAGAWLILWARRRPLPP